MMTETDMQPTVDQEAAQTPAGQDRSGDSTPVETFDEGDFVLFVGRAKRAEKEYLKRLDTGKVISLKGEDIKCDKLIGQPVGASIVTPLNQSFLMLRPTLAQRIMNMPREAQILYPKDLALMIYWADVQPGSRVVEVGIGHGAMSMSLVRAVGSTGAMTSYEIRPDFAKRTRKNARRYLGETPWWEIKLQNPVEEGIDERGVDAVIVDMPTPWEVIPAVAEALKPSGTATFFIPNVTQVIELTDALVAAKVFAQYRTTEAMVRPWRVSGNSVRPEMIISGHTGFIVNCRRKAGEVIRLTRD